MIGIAWPAAFSPSLIVAALRTSARIEEILKREIYPVVRLYLGFGHPLALDLKLVSLGRDRQVGSGKMLPQSVDSLFVPRPQLGEGILAHPFRSRLFQSQLGRNQFLRVQDIPADQLPPVLETMTVRAGPGVCETENLHAPFACRAPRKSAKTFRGASAFCQVERDLVL